MSARNGLIVDVLQFGVKLKISDQLKNQSWVHCNFSGCDSKTTIFLIRAIGGVRKHTLIHPCRASLLKDEHF